ncbi:DUF4136 domain-containing protein [Mesonia ostreae]|uniref:DUF4136 domain-containing protein n=1 Tax=Mesonia ostreae TaxID=861110 RepID=A0ABU2KLG6_9FLAO|nr:DUF4136 domain-containing protein [Mesonia ostreae]MDT0295543.1 DUF4136 domain-containing protein [Mesonia ostreae]
MKQLFFFLGMISLISCGGPKAFYDYDEKMDFEQCQNFSYYTNIESGLSELDEERFMQSLSKSLKNQGYQQSENSDFRINFYAEFFEERNNNTIGIGVGSGGGAVRGGISGGIPLGGIKQFISLTIEFTNALNDELFWQAVVESKFDRELSPKEREEAFLEIAKKALENFPPEK